jgi:hypothetical protein
MFQAQLWCKHGRTQLGVAEKRSNTARAVACVCVWGGIAGPNEVYLATHLNVESVGDVSRQETVGDVEQHHGRGHGMMPMGIEPARDSHQHDRGCHGQELYAVAQHRAEQALVARESEHVGVDDLPALLIIHVCSGGRC